jgi:PhnB protein
MRLRNSFATWIESNISLQQIGSPMSSATVTKDYHTVTPYLVVNNVLRLLEFLSQAFGAMERIRLPRDDGSVMHAEVAMGDSIVMMGELRGDMTPMPASLFLRVPDADAAYQSALNAGATSVSEPTDQPHAGERYGGVKDPCGSLWWPATPLPAVKSSDQVELVDARVTSRAAARMKKRLLTPRDEQRVAA